MKTANGGAHVLLLGNKKSCGFDWDKTMLCIGLNVFIHKMRTTLFKVFSEDWENMYEILH